MNIKDQIHAEVREWHRQKPFACDARVGLPAQCAQPAVVAAPMGIGLSPMCFCLKHEARAGNPRYTLAPWGTIRLETP